MHLFYNSEGFSSTLATHSSELNLGLCDSMLFCFTFRRFLPWSQEIWRSTGSPSFCGANVCFPGSGAACRVRLEPQMPGSSCSGCFLSTTRLSAPSICEPCSFPMSSSLIQGQCPSQVKGPWLKTTWCSFLWIKEVAQSLMTPRDLSL